MNCNKLKALQEKGIAENMIINNDYVGARDKLLKAQQLFPALDHIGPMLSVCDILSAANNKLPGYEIDYYWVLQLIPSSTFTDVKCRYQKMVTSLQPIRNKFPGTELALKLLCNAFSVLSDQEKRLAFDLKRDTSWELNRQAICHSVSSKEKVIATQSSSGVSSSQPLDGSNRQCLTTKAFSKTVGDLQLMPLTSLDDPSCFSSAVNCKGNMETDGDMFAESTNLLSAAHTVCLNRNLFWSSKVVVQRKLDQDFYHFENNRKAELLQAGQIWAAHFWSNAPQNCRYAQISISSESEVSVTWLKPIPVTSGERRWCDVGLPVACGSFYLDPEMSERMGWPGFFSYNCSWICGVTEEQIEIYPKRGEVWALYKDWDLDKWAFNPETVKGCKFLLVEILSDFEKYMGADGACLVKVDGFRSIYQRQTKEGQLVIFHICPDNLYMFSHHVPSYRFTGGEIDKVVDGMFELDQLALPHDFIQDMDTQIALKLPEHKAFTPHRGSRPLTLHTDTQMALKKDISISWPSFTPPVQQISSLQSYLESELFKPNRLPNDFAIGQVWAVYCGNAFMPQQYARINNVISKSQVCVTFLEPQPILDCEINWKKENIPFVCGIFKAGGINVNLEMSQLSHLVNCQQSATDPFYDIYPMKGEIWAVYRDWNNKWKHSDYEHCQCHVVEILSDILEGTAVTITRLGEVRGCATFFHRQQYDGFDLICTVSKTEMLNFSHQIPAFRVPGIEKYGIPECTWHLEPQALPPRNGN